MIPQKEMKKFYFLPISIIGVVLLFGYMQRSRVRPEAKLVSAPGGITVETASSANLKESPEAWENGARTDGGEGTFEWWYLDAQMDDGSVAVVAFSTKPINRVGGSLAPPGHYRHYSSGRIHDS